MFLNFVEGSWREKLENSTPTTPTPSSTHTHKQAEQDNSKQKDQLLELGTEPVTLLLQFFKTTILLLCYLHNFMASALEVALITVKPIVHEEQYLV